MHLHVHTKTGNNGALHVLQIVLCVVRWYNALGLQYSLFTPRRGQVGNCQGQG